MKIISLSFTLLFFSSTNLFSWHYNCISELASLLFDNTSISNKAFLIFNYKDISLKLTDDDVIQTPLQNNITLINVKFSNKNHNKMWIEFPQDNLEDYVDFEGKIFLEDSSGSVKLIRVKCSGQKVMT